MARGDGPDVYPRFGVKNVRGGGAGRKLCQREQCNCKEVLDASGRNGSCGNVSDRKEMGVSIYWRWEGHIMTLITIEIEYENMRVVYGKSAGSRLTWACAGLQIFVAGSLAGLRFEQAANLAAHVCSDIHIPVSSLRYQGKSAKKRAVISETVDMFERGKK